MFVGAAVIPPIAVALANAVDLRRAPDFVEDEQPVRRELSSGGVVPGSVEDD